MAVASPHRILKEFEVNGNSLMEAARKLALEKAEADANRAYAAGMAEESPKMSPALNPVSFVPTFRVDPHPFARGGSVALVSVAVCTSTWRLSCCNSHSPVMRRP